MKFPRSARIFRGHLDVAPFASVFFLLVVFALLGALLYTPGVHVELPAPNDLLGTNDLSGTDQPTIAVAVDATGRFYFENQPIEESALKSSLEQAAKKSPEPLTLLVLADKQVAYDKLMRLTLLARNAGIRDALFAPLPRVYPAPSTLPYSKP
jgi:biopolymer transport protein ExbD